MTPNVRIIRDCSMSLDGINSKEYKVGQEVSVPADLVRSVTEGKAPKGLLLDPEPTQPLFSSSIPNENQDAGAPSEHQAFVDPAPERVRPRLPDPPKAAPAPVRKAGVKPIPVRDKNGVKVGEHELRS